MREIVHEKPRREQAACIHGRMCWLALAMESGGEQIRWGCPDCGWRDRTGGKFADHPNRATYPLIVPRRQYDDYSQRTWNYGEYLRSEAWQERRHAVLNRAGHRCQVCGSSQALNVHHNTYSRLGAELESDLCVLCRTCHEVFERNGRLVDWREDAA
jgi:5-methylcytosine-specific restriction endonuclease McrA